MPSLPADPPATAGAAALARQLFDAKSIAALDALDANAAGTVLLVHGTAGEAGLVGAAAAAQRLVPDPAVAVTDIITTRPAGDRWTLAEIDDLVLAGARRMPAGSKTVVVVGFGEALGREGWDHLLKTLEEPAPTSRFVVAAADAGRLPATIRGRVTATVALALAGPAERVAAAVAAGADPAVAAKVFDACGPLVTLAAAAAANPEAVAALDVLFDEPDLRRPVSAAVGAADMLAQLTALVPDAGGGLRRDLLRQILDHHHRRIRRRLREAADAAAFAVAQAELDALAQAAVAVDRYVAPVDVLAGWWCQLALNRQVRPAGAHSDSPAGTSGRRAAPPVTRRRADQAGR